MNKYIIWLIDDDEEELTTYGNELKLDMSQEIQIKAILPYPRKIDYVSTLLEDPDTACIIIDQKLKERGMPLTLELNWLSTYAVLRKKYRFIY
jgi:hypothetical protein